jgi:hypothetical protein
MEFHQEWVGKLKRRKPNAANFKWEFRQLKPDPTGRRFDVAEMAMPTGRFAAAQPRNGSGRQFIGCGCGARKRSGNKAQGQTKHSEFHHDGEPSKVVPKATRTAWPENAAQAAALTEVAAVIVP